MKLIFADFAELAKILIFSALVIEEKMYSICDLVDLVAQVVNNGEVSIFFFGGSGWMVSESGALNSFCVQKYKEHTFFVETV